jgi:hypothetical protein
VRPLGFQLTEPARDTRDLALTGPILMAFSPATSHAANETPPAQR